LPVDRLKAGDRLIGIGADNLEVERVYSTSETENVYNLITSGEHNFIVDGIVAHNFTFLREARCLLHHALFDSARASHNSPEPLPIYGERVRP
jgi:hypothetical protein